MTLTKSLTLLASGACLNTLAGCSAHTAPASSAGTTSPAAPPPLSASAPALEQAYVAVLARALPSVVQITTDRGLGSKVAFDKQGDVVTNAHVVGTSTHFQVRLSASPTPVPATLVGAYPPDDLAVIKLGQPPTTLTPAVFGNSDQLRIGDIVLAVGNPLGLAGSVTNGIMSATGGTISEPPTDGPGATLPGATLPDVIQTSAAINPGNSGGTLIDLSGQVVGVPTLAALDPQLGGGSAPGIGFAVPSNLVTDIASQHVRNGHVIDSHRAELGVDVVTVLGPDGQPSGAGVATVVAGGPAATAGIPASRVVRSAARLTGWPAIWVMSAPVGMRSGQQVPVVLTDPGRGATRTVTVTLRQLPGSGE